MLVKEKYMWERQLYTRKADYEKHEYKIGKT